MLSHENGATRFLTNATYLETPENVRLAFHLAGPGTRLGAYLVDLAIRTTALYGFVLVASLVLSPLAMSGLPIGVYFIVSFALEWGYGCLFETHWNGQTPGKRIFRLRVIKTEGYAIGFHDAMIRNLLRAADFAPLFYGAGFLAAVSNPRMQRIGDLVAGTMVVREPRDDLGGEPLGLSEVTPFALENFRDRYRVSERTREHIENLFRRRFELAPERVDEIASILAVPLLAKLASREDRTFARGHPAEFLFRVLRACRDRAEGPPSSVFAIPSTGRTAKPELALP